MRRLLPFVLVLLLPFAQAQGQEDFVDVEVTITPAIIALGEDVEQAEYQVTVTNPTDNPFPGTVVLTTSAAPEGWTIELSDNTFQLTGDQDRTVTLTVAASRAAEEGTIAITVTATITYDGLAQQFTAEDSASVEASYEKGLLSGFGEGFGGSVLLLALLGAVALVVIIVIAVTATGGGITLTAPQHHIEAPPGSVVQVPLTLQNRARRDDNVTIGVGRLPRGWEAGLEEESLHLPPRSNKRNELKVLMPKDAEGRVAVSVAAHSQRTGKSVEVHMTIQVIHKKE